MGTRTVRDALRALAERDSVGLRFEDRSWTWREHIQASIDRAQLLLHLRPDGPFHVGVLLDNVPEFSFLLGAAAFAGATIVGINPTRRGAGLARDIAQADCGILITESRYLPLLKGIELAIPKDRTFCIDQPEWSMQTAKNADSADPSVPLDPKAPYLLIFTSGTTGHPKAAICSQARLASMGEIAAKLLPGGGIGPEDVCYHVMPMFHSSQLAAGWMPAVTVGATMVLRRKFSASAFLPDVRHYGVTYFNYVGKPLTYILATPERPDDGDNPLRIAFGNEGAEHDLARFARRFQCEVSDAYGSTEGGISVQRVAGMPAGSLGMGNAGTAILDPETGEECLPARFDADGRLLNADRAIGEIVNRETASRFEGYYKNEEANRSKVRDGIVWSGDLGYRDEKGFIYFGGRSYDWLRVDGENFAAAPVERILVRHPDVSLAAVYAVPDSDVGDQVMATLILEPGKEFDPADFASFLAAQDDLGTKWSPRYIRIAQDVPMTETNKILKRVLRSERWECNDPVWSRSSQGEYRRLTPEDVVAIRERFSERGRLAALEP